MTLDLFGGAHPWSTAEWTASDDRVRGGKSQSCFKVSSGGASASFYGNLDITTLGGAGLASQRTTSKAGGPWNLQEYDGISLTVLGGDEKIYTLVIKDEILPKMKDGREQSTISYEYSFRIEHAKAPLLSTSKEDENKSASHSCFIPWNSLKPFYRGKPKKDAKDLEKGSVKRISIMMRSHFGKQEGDFQITIGTIAACTRNEFEKVCEDQNDAEGWEVVEVVDAIDAQEGGDTEGAWKCCVM